MHVRLDSPVWDDLVDELREANARASTRADTTRERPTTEVWPPPGGAPEDDDDDDVCFIVSPLTAVLWD